MWYRLVRKCTTNGDCVSIWKDVGVVCLKMLTPALTCVLRIARRNLSPASQNVTTGPPDHAAIFGLNVPLPRVHEHSSFMVENLRPCSKEHPLFHCSKCNTCLSSDLHVTCTTVIQITSLKQPTNGIHVVQTLRVTMCHAASICHCHKPYSLKLFRISFVYLRTTSRSAQMIKHLLKVNEWTMN